jgi:hypothetical protein
VGTEEALWRSHLALVATAISLGIFLVKVLAVSHGDLTTASAVLQTTEPVDVVSIVALTLVSGAVFGVVVGALGVVAWYQWSAGHFPGVYIATLVILALTSAILLPPWFWLAPLVVAAAATIGPSLWRWWRRVRRQSVGKANDSAGGSEDSVVVVSLRALVIAYAGDRPFRVILTLALLFALLNDTMWLPGQVLKVADGPEFTAYVLDDSPDDVTVLLQADRTVARLKRSDVTFLEFCRPPGMWAGSRFRGDAYRPCPDGSPSVVLRETSS